MLVGALLFDQLLLLTGAHEGYKVSSNSPSKGDNKPKKHPFGLSHSHDVARDRIMQGQNGCGSCAWRGKCQILLDHKMASEGDSKKETIESGRDSKQGQRYDVLARCSHQPELVQGGDSRDKATEQTTGGSRRRLGRDVFLSAEEPATPSEGQTRGKWFDDSKGENGAKNASTECPAHFKTQVSVGCSYINESSNEKIG